MMTNQETLTNTVAKLTKGNAWIKKDVDGNIKLARVYYNNYKNSYAIIEADGVNIDKINGNHFGEIKTVLKNNNINYYRA